MQAYGSDRVRPGRGEQWILLSPRSKGWVARTPARTAVATEAPGSAILWEERYFEVVSATPSGSGVRYVLEPWRDENVMRSTDAYDAASEARRDADYRAAVGREKGRKLANLFGVFTGHLPAPVQERLGSEIGILPTRLTVMSLLLPLVVIALIVDAWVERVMAQQGGIPMGLKVLAVYLGVESAVRLNVVWSQMRPMGSAAGLLAYTIFYLVAPNRRALTTPVRIDRADRLQLEVEPEVARRDAFVVREPLLTLLRPDEQRLLEERFGFDYRRTASTVALTLLVICGAGVATSVSKVAGGGGLSPLLSLIAAGGLAIEQIVRLAALRRGPVGSVLAPIVRPFARKLFV